MFTQLVSILNLAGTNLGHFCKTAWAEKMRDGMKQWQRHATKQLETIPVKAKSKKIATHP